MTPQFPRQIAALTGCNMNSQRFNRVRRGFGGKALIGILCFAVAFYGAYTLASRRAAQARAVQAMEQAIAAANADVAAATRAGKLPNQGELVDRMAAAMNKAAPSLVGTDRKAISRMAQCLQSARPILTDYETNVNAVASAMRPNSIKSREDIETARRCVREFQAASQGITAHNKAASAEFRRGLASDGVREPELTKLSNAIERTFNSPSVQELRKYDQEIGQAVLEMMNFLDENWGKWRYDEKQQRLLFEDTQQADAYNALVGKLRTVSQKQVEAQQNAMKH